MQKCKLSQKALADKVMKFMGELLWPTVNQLLYLLILFVVCLSKQNMSMHRPQILVHICADINFGIAASICKQATKGLE